MKKETGKRRNYRRTIRFGAWGTAAFVCLTGLTVFFALRGNRYGAAASLALLSFSLQSVMCLIGYAIGKNRAFCFARDCYTPFWLTVYGGMLLGISVGCVLLVKWWGVAFSLLPAWAFFSTLSYRAFLFGKRDFVPDATDFYLETVVTSPFYVNGADVFSEQTRVFTGERVVLLCPDNQREIAEVPVYLVQGKDCAFRVAYASVSDGVYALYLVTARDHELLCVIEGFDRSLASDRIKNQALFDQTDFPAFHEEGYYYTNERETRFCIEQEEGSFVVVEQALYWDAFFYRNSDAAAPYVWEEIGCNYFEYYQEAVTYLRRRLAEENAEDERRKRGSFL